MGIDGAESIMIARSTLSSAKQEASVPLGVLIPPHVPHFAAPTFRYSIIGSYLATVIAVLFFPTRESSTLWMPATLFGQSLGGALSIAWNTQWNALWMYEEV
jgi:hypothetical protein